MLKILLIIMIWEISLVMAFIGGYLFKHKKKRRVTEERIPTEEEKREFSRIQKEHQNFMLYDGTPQEAINDYDY